MIDSKITISSVQKYNQILIVQTMVQLFQLGKNKGCNQTP